MPAELVKIFFHTGNPDGIREAEIAMSTTKAVAFLRDALTKACVDAPDIKKPGVYLLIGTDPDDGWKAVYIGESEDVCSRLGEHSKSTEKDFWQETVVLVVKDDWLTKGHIRDIEARLIVLAKNGTWKVMNGKNGGETAGKLPASDRAVISRFVDQCRSLVEMLGYDVFKPKKIESGSVQANRYMFGSGYNATAFFDEETGIIIVKAGSIARSDEGQSIPKSAKTDRARLINDGLLDKQQQGLLFTGDVEFKSMSAAASVVAATSVSGPLAWKDMPSDTLPGIS